MRSYSMWRVKSNRDIREARRIHKQAIDAYEPGVSYNIIGHVVFWVMMILVGFILGLIWVLLENK
jgi:hypothetical protein